MVSGSCVSSASSPPCGIENGLWLNSICSVSSSRSNIGKSTIQQKRNSSSARSGPAPAPILVRARAGELRRRRLLVADEEHRVAVAQRRSAPCSRASRARVEELGDRALGRRPRRRRCSRGPARPRRAPSRSACRRSCAAARRRRAPGWRAPPPPASTAPAKTLEAGAAEDLADVGDERAGCADRACRCRISASPRR